MMLADKNSSLTGARILILFPHMTLPGGALTYTLKLVELLLSKGATVGIMTLQAEPEKYNLPQGVQLIDVGGPVTSRLRYWLLFPLWQRRLTDQINEWQPDIIVPQVFPSNWWGFLYKKGHPLVKLVWVCHEPSAFIHSPEWIGGLKPLWKKLLAHILRPLLSPVDISLARYSDAIITNSKFTANLVWETYGKRVDVVAYPGIDYQLFSTESFKKQRALITVAHLTKYKRIDFLLKVFALLKDSQPDLVYHIVGDGDEMNNLKSLAERLEVTDRVIFHGRLSHVEIAELNAKSLLFLHGSINETFGMAPLEAIACGTPVLAHNSGGPREFITDSCGRLIDSLEIGAWAHEVREYLDSLPDDDEFTRQVRESARIFDWSITLRPAVETIGNIYSARQQKLLRQSNHLAGQG